MNWNHIMDKQPEHGRKIIQVDQPYEGHYPMGMREYYQPMSFEELMKSYKQMEMNDPDFWWVYVEDFPFPDMTQKRVNLRTTRNNVKKEKNV